MDDEDFLAAVEADNKGVPEEPVTEQVTEPAPEPTPEPVAEPQAEVTPEPLELTTDQIVDPKPDAAEGRLSALLDERDKRKAAEAELERLRAAQQQQQPVQMPDPYEDPEGFARAQEVKVNQALYMANLRWSERVATIEHGAELVGKAKAWATQRADEDPHFNAKALASPDPIGFAVSEYRRDEIASKVDPSKFERYLAWEAAQSQLQQQPGAQPPSPTPTSAIPTPSLASAPSAGTILTEPVQSDEEIFNEVVGKR